MATPNNYSDQEMWTPSEAERYIWAVYFLFGLLSSLIGDTLILIASFQKEALKINRLIVVVMQHIAVSDLLTAISFALPKFISLLSNTRIFGETMCKVGHYTSVVFYVTHRFHRNQEQRKLVELL